MRKNKQIIFITIRDRRTGKKRVIPIVPESSSVAQTRKVRMIKEGKNISPEELEWELQAKRSVQEVLRKWKDKPRRKDLEKELMNWAKGNAFVKQMFRKYGLDSNKLLKKLKLVVSQDLEAEKNLDDAKKRLVNGETFLFPIIELKVRSKAPRYRILSVLVHELAHYVYYQAGSFDQRMKRWVEASWDNLTLPYFKRKAEQFALVWEIYFLKSLGFSESGIIDEFWYHLYHSGWMKSEEDFNNLKGFIKDVLSGKYDGLLEI
jgi:hypothetical protein